MVSSTCVKLPYIVPSETVMLMIKYILYKKKNIVLFILSNFIVQNILYSMNEDI